MRSLIGFVVSNSHVLTDKLYNTLQVYLDQWTIPDTCICRTSAQKAELKVVGVFGGETGVSVLVCTWGAAFKMDWWSFGVFQQIL